MLLAIDIGNSNIVFGIFEDNLLIHKWRLVTNSKATADDYAIDIVELCLNNKFNSLSISGIIIGSVVPNLTPVIKEAIKKVIDQTKVKEIFIAGEGRVIINIKNELQNKKEVGVDRLLNSVAGFKKFGGNLIIVDFGTATTFDVVGEKGEYLGGVITAGVNLSLKALHEMTAKLPFISIKTQNNVIGKNTVEAMNSGAYFGSLALLDGTVKEISKELNKNMTTIITGGAAETFKNALNFKYEPDLTLEGLKIVYKSIST